jgi:hypothetical protein
MHRESENPTSDIPSVTYFSAYGANGGCPRPIRDRAASGQNGRSGEAAQSIIGTQAVSLISGVHCAEADMSGRCAPDAQQAIPEVLSPIERPRTADEPIFPNVESQQTIGCARNADAFALPDFA